MIPDISSSRTANALAIIHRHLSAPRFVRGVQEGTSLRCVLLESGAMSCYPNCKAEGHISTAETCHLKIEYQSRAKESPRNRHSRSRTRRCMRFRSSTKRRTQPQQSPQKSCIDTADQFAQLSSTSRSRSRSSSVVTYFQLPRSVSKQAAMHKPLPKEPAMSYASAVGTATAR